jgi:hypothetical protein
MKNKSTLKIRKEIGKEAVRQLGEQLEGMGLINRIVGIRSYRIQGSEDNNYKYEHQFEINERSL